MIPDSLSIEAIGAVVAGLPDNGLAASRRTSLDNLRRDGLPDIRDEDWKYTDVAPLIGIANRWLDQGAVLQAPAPNPTFPEIDVDWIVVTNGRIDDGSVAALPDGVTVSRLSESADQLVPAGRLGDLNVALLQDGLTIVVEAGVKLQKPVGIYFFDQAGEQSGVCQARADILVGAGARAGFVEYHASVGPGELYSNSVVNLAVGPSAQADYVRIQRRSDNHSQTSHLAVRLDRDARLRHASFDLGGRLVRNDLVVDIAEPGAEAQFGGLYLVGDGQHIDNHTRVDHRVGPAVSNQEYRGVLDGNARGVWNGKAIVHEGADGTDARQSNHNLLLSRKAEIDAKPELEIYADDVKCSHGTTVGQLDETALFYLRTRGLGREDARQMLTRAFAQSVISGTPVRSLEDHLTQVVVERLRELMHEDGE